MTTDNPGQPEQAEDATQRPATDAEQTVSLNTQQVAQQLGVDSRTVRRYIVEGLHTPGGSVLRLEARQVRNNRGPEWQVYQTDLEKFRQERDRQATEGHTPPGGAGAGQQLALRSEENQALAIQLIGAELERRSAALSEAQQTIERLAREAGQHAGRAQELERELEAERLHVKALEHELEAERQKDQGRIPRRVRLLPWQRREED